jgi:hypothetical protein
MNGKLDIGPYLVRFVITILISVVVVAAINEGAYLFQKEKHDRPPKTIQMVIPAGTAGRLAEGESIDSIPEKMVFVTGDVLEVINQDAVSHQLGPVWVPAGATGRLELNEPNRYAYSCSFSTSRYLGLDVRQPTGLDTRLSALALAAPPTAAFLFLYGLLVFPIKPAEKQGGSKRSKG